MVRFKFKSALALLSFGLVWLFLERMNLFKLNKETANRKFKTFFAPDSIDTWPYVSQTNFLLLIR